MRGSWIRLCVLGAIAIGPAHAVALPPPSAALAQTSISGGRWVEHMVIPGERLAEIAERYAVEVAKIIEWNSLDSDKPALRIGQRLRVLSRTAAAPRKRQRYKVQAGDNWSKIARRFEVDTDKLQRHWNPGVGDLRPGDHVIVWVERDGSSAEPAPEVEAAPAPASTSAKLAAVVEPTHGDTKPSTAAALAAVVEPKAASPAPTPQLRSASSASPAPQQAAKPPAIKAAPAPALAAAAVVTSKPASSPGTTSATASKPASSPSTTSATASKPASSTSTASKPASTTSAQPAAGTLAAVLQPRVTSTQSAASVSTAQPAATKASGPQPRRVGQFVLMPVTPGGQSVGSPTRGRVRNAVQLPENAPLYTIRNPDHSWGSSHAVEQLQVGMAIFREQTGFKRQIMVCDMSLRNGGRFRPHRSHTSGRDVDIRLPLRAGVPEETLPENPAVVDWDMTWSMVKALIATGEVHYLFLARSRQVHLYKAAQRAGESEEDLTVLMQYPGHGRNTLVRHSAGHTKHMHVRWNCAPDEEQCME